MKTYKFIILALFISTFCFAQQSRTESNHSIHANISAFNYHAGLGYSYEWAFAPKWTLLGSAWLKGEFSWGENFMIGKYSTFILHPTISAAPRFYYNLNRREQKGKNTAFNSGNYLGTTFSGFLPSINRKSGAYRDFVHYGIAPHWGMRRVYWNKFLLEFHAGIIILAGNGDTAWGPDLNLKLGYVF